MKTIDIAMLSNVIGGSSCKDNPPPPPPQQNNCTGICIQNQDNSQKTDKKDGGTHIQVGPLSIPNPFAGK